MAARPRRPRASPSAAAVPTSHEQCGRRPPEGAPRRLSAWRAGRGPKGPEVPPGSSCLPTPDGRLSPHSGTFPGGWRLRGPGRVPPRGSRSAQPLLSWRRQAFQQSPRSFNFSPRLEHWSSPPRVGGGLPGWRAGRRKGAWRIGRKQQARKGPEEVSPPARSNLGVGVQQSQNRRRSLPSWSCQWPRSPRRREKVGSSNNPQMLSFNGRWDFGPGPDSRDLY